MAERFGFRLRPPRGHELGFHVIDDGLQIDGVRRRWNRRRWRGRDRLAALGLCRTAVRRGDFRRRLGDLRVDGLQLLGELRARRVLDRFGERVALRDQRIVFVERLGMRRARLGGNVRRLTRADGRGFFGLGLLRGFLDIGRAQLRSTRRGFRRARTRDVARPGIDQRRLEPFIRAVECRRFGAEDVLILMAGLGERVVEPVEPIIVLTTKKVAAFFPFRRQREPRLVARRSRAVCGA